MLKARFHPVARSVQNTRPHYRTTALVHVSFLLLPSSIACLAILPEYDNSSCDADSFTVELPKFMRWAGGIQLILCPLVWCVHWVVHHTKDPFAMEFRTGWWTCIYPAEVFSCIWAIIGLNIYTTEMSKNCRRESVGIAILIWSLIQVRTSFYPTIQAYTWHYMLYALCT